MSPPHILATLDLSKKSERDAQAFLKRACAGRWPMWRMFGMCRRGNTLFVAVEWLRCGTEDRYSVVELSLHEPAACWRSFQTKGAARKALALLDAVDAQPAAAVSDTSNGGRHGNP